jgi:hypothetical protein
MSRSVWPVSSVRLELLTQAREYSRHTSALITGKHVVNTSSIDPAPRVVVHRARHTRELALKKRTDDTHLSFVMKFHKKRNHVHAPLPRENRQPNPKTNFLAELFGAIAARGRSVPRRIDIRDLEPGMSVFDHCHSARQTHPHEPAKDLRKAPRPKTHRIAEPAEPRGRNLRKEHEKQKCVSAESPEIAVESTEPENGNGNGNGWDEVEGSTGQQSDGVGEQEDHAVDEVDENGTKADGDLGEGGGQFDEDFDEGDEGEDQNAVDQNQWELDDAGDIDFGF